MDSTQESTRRRYRVTVRYRRVSDEDADPKKRAIVGVLLEAARRRSALKRAEVEGA